MRSAFVLSGGALVVACANAPPPPQAVDVTIPPVPHHAAAGAGPTEFSPPRREALRKTYAQALAENDPATARGVELTDAELSAPMRNATFIGACGAPDSMKVTVKVAVKNGRAIGVSVYTTPPEETVTRCVDDRIRAMTWKASPNLDSFTTTY